MNILNIKKRNSGFTLVEILIVLVILAGIVVMLTRGTMSGRKAALANQTKIDMEGRVKTAIVAKVALLGRMPQANDLTEAALGFKAGELVDPFKEAYEITPGPGNKEATISPKAGGKAKDYNTPNVTVDLEPFLP
ncbi:MAG: type II secretion system GspH family protein [Puniceicoccales bacterium]|jgi:prepilin-type N-terminal cleavage/methylation domain-containing protein|nr:type II secretion system GspH family protein [Puniceicoccales bacterium]